ncbi:MAG: hypothetical protein ACKOFW_01380, partial [Planctomycetaceae bacterium]
MIENLGEPLLQRLSSLRSRVRGVVWLSGLSRLVVCGLGLVVLAVLADVLYRLNDPGVRLLCLLGVLGVVAWLAWKRLFLPLRTGLGDLDLALRIERVHPGMRDALSSGVQFTSGKGDPAVGSPALQRVAVAQAARQIETLDLEECVPPTAAGLWALGAAGMLALSAILVLVSPQKASLGLQRLLLPFHAADWPRQDSLQLLSGDLEPLPHDDAPLQVPRGEQFRFHVANLRGALPPRVQLETRPVGSRRSATAESLRPINVANPLGGFREVSVGNLPAPREEIEFRVVGGDDDTMAWRRLKTVNAPSAEELQLVITPPAYTRRPSERLPAGVGHVTALVGSRVTVEAQASRPLVSAQLRLRDRDRQPLQLAGDNRAITGEFTVREAGASSWWFELRDLDGVQSSELVRYELRGIADLVPETDISRPAADQRVTPRASVPLEIASRDDLGLARVVVLYTVDEGPETTHPLFELETRPTELASSWVFELEPLGLRPGQVVRIQSEAHDDFIDPETQARHVARSVVRTLTVVDDREKSIDLEQQQAELMHDLEQALRQQQQAREQTRSLELQLEKAGNLRPEDVDALKRTELLQREISSQVKSPTAGLDRQARAALEELRNNRLSDSTTERRLEALSEELRRLGEVPLPEIENALGQARKLTEQADTGASLPSLGLELARAREQQSEVAESLADLQRQLAEWRDDRSLGQDLQGLQVNQARISEQTEQLQRRLEEGQAGDTPAQSEADLARLAEQQAEQARQFTQLQQRLQDRVDGSRGRQNAASSGRTPPPGTGTDKPQKPTATPGESPGQPDQTDPDKPSSGDSPAPDGQQPSPSDPAGKSPDQNSPQSNPSDNQANQGGPEPAESRPASTPQRPDDPRGPSQAEQALAETLEEANRGDIAGKMQDAASRIQEKKLRNAAELQKQLQQNLKSLQDILEQRREQDEAVLVKKMEESVAELNSLEQQQQDLQEQLAQAASQPEGPERQEQLQRLRQQQQQIREEANRLARLLQRAGADRAADALQRAGNQMGDAEEGIAQADPEQAEEEMREALDNLEETRDELEEELAEVRERLADELLEKIVSEIRALRDRQAAAILETRRLTTLSQAAGKWSRAQLVSIRALAQSQRGLQEEADALAERLQPAKVFQLSLAGVARTLGRVVERLEKRDVNDATVALQESARARLQQLVEAIEARQPEAAAANRQEPQQPGDEAGGAAGGPPGSESISAIAQLKILLELQRELESRTAELDALKNQPGSAWTEENAEELSSLREEQEQLADLTSEMADILAQALDPGDDAEDESAEMDNTADPEADDND